MEHDSDDERGGGGPDYAAMADDLTGAVRLHLHLGNAAVAAALREVAFAAWAASLGDEGGGPALARAADSAHDDLRGYCRLVAVRALLRQIVRHLAEHGVHHPEGVVARTADAGPGADAPGPEPG